MVSREQLLRDVWGYRQRSVTRRTQIDWECELGVVMRRVAKNVPAAQAMDFIFGYTISLDMSDRGGRWGEKEPRQDWFVGKSHETS